MADDQIARKRELNRVRAQKFRDAAKAKRDAGDPDAIAKYEAERERERQKKRKNCANDAPAAVNHRARKRQRQAEERAGNAPQADAHRAVDRACKVSSKKKQLLKWKAERRPYRVKVAGKCERCNVRLLDCEIASARGNKLQCPACSGQVIKGLSQAGLQELKEAAQAPPELLELCCDSSAWADGHRRINHKASFTTTHVTGPGFKEPPSPCTLNLAGQIVRWIRPANPDVPMPIYDVRNAMEQFWVTPDAGAVGWDEVAWEHLAAFRDIIATHHSMANVLFEAAQLRDQPGMEQHDVVLSFPDGDAGPEVSAVFHSASPDRLPPHMQVVVWPRNAERPKGQPVDELVGNVLTYPALWPYGLTNLNCNVPLLDYARFLIHHMPGPGPESDDPDELKHWRLSPRLVQEWLLSVWSVTESRKLSFYYNAHSAGTLNPGGDDDYEGDDGEAAEMARGADDASAADHAAETIAAAGLAAIADGGFEDTDGGRGGGRGDNADTGGEAGTSGRTSKPFYKKSFIPSSHMCGPRFFRKRFNELLVAAAAFGTNNMMFVTVTANELDELLEDFGYCPNPKDRVDGAARSFHGVADQVWRDLCEGIYLPNGWCLKTTADYGTCVTEFQKRGRPHIHIVVHFPGRVFTPEEVDEIMWTRMPTAAEERERPGLTALVNKFMVHSHTDRCGGNKGPCCWGFPHPPCARTHRAADGRWVTRRGEDDKWIAAYNPDLLYRLKRHANFLVTSGTKSIAYLLAYPLKGDASIRAAIRAATEEDGKCDEVKIAQVMRVVSACEALYRVCNYRIVKQFPPVETIKATLPEERFAYGSVETAKKRLEEHNTDVDKYFKRPAAMEEVDFRGYFERFTLSKREPKTKAAHRDTIGYWVTERAKAKLVNVVPARFNTTKFFARMLLLQKDSCVRSWEDLRRVAVTRPDGECEEVQCETFEEAAHARGLMQDHQTAVDTLVEFFTSQLTSPARARLLFVLVIQAFTCEVPKLLDDFLEHLVEPAWPEADKRRLVLEHLQRSLRAENRELHEYGIEDDLEEPPLDEPPVDVAMLDAADHLYDDQQRLYDAACKHLDLAEPQQPMLMHAEGEPGAGKSLVLNALLNYARSCRHRCLPAAFPAKVARKFKGGQTAHFHLGLSCADAGEEIQVEVADPDDASKSKRARERGALIRAARLVFIDEITMMRGEQLDAIVEMLMWIGFRGVFLIVGNCAQLGPVLRGLGLSDQIHHCIVRAKTFALFQHFRLNGQMRCKDPELRAALHAIGYGALQAIDGVPYDERPAARVRMPTDLFPAVAATDENVEALRNWVHGDGDPAGERALRGAIVCSLVSRAQEHNGAMLDRIEGDARVYASRDVSKPVRDGDAAFENVELTEKTSKLCDEGSIPPSQLELKVGAPVHIMQNLDRTVGLVKGELATVLELRPSHVVVRLHHAEDPNADIWPLPRVCFEYRPKRLPVTIIRHQIPLMLAWASTVHRVQGDDLERVGVDMRDEYFAHGQLHVAASRGHSRDETRYLVNADDLHDGYFEATNVVVPQVLFTDDLGEGGAGPSNADAPIVDAFAAPLANLPPFNPPAYIDDEDAGSEDGEVP